MSDYLVIRAKLFDGEDAPPDDYIWAAIESLSDALGPAFDTITFDFEFDDEELED